MSSYTFNDLLNGLPVLIQGIHGELTFYPICVCTDEGVVYTRGVVERGDGLSWETFLTIPQLASKAIDWFIGDQAPIPTPKECTCDLFAFKGCTCGAIVPYDENR